MQTELYLPQNSYVEALTPNIMGFGNGVFGGNWLRKSMKKPRANIMFNCEN